MSSTFITYTSVRVLQSLEFKGLMYRVMALFDGILFIRMENAT